MYLPESSRLLELMDVAARSQSSIAVTISTWSIAVFFVLTGVRGL